MAKRKTFEEELATDFRWPIEGDTPFVTATTPFENAHIAENKFLRLAFMKKGYNEAAKLMVASTTKDPTQRDVLVFPIIFNYRQFLELSLKYLLASYGAVVGVKPNWSTHDLAVLWGKVLVMLEKYGTEDPDKADPIVGKVILEFAKIDPGSYSHRYPVDRQGKPIPVSNNNLHLPTLADVMEGVANYFEGCDGYLDNLLGALPGNA